MTEERDQLQTSYNNLTEERDQLQTNYNDLTKERDQLQTSYNNLNKEQDQLQTSYNNLTEERDQLQTNYHDLTKERDQLQTSYNNLNKERDQLQTSYNNLNKQRDQLQTSYNNLNKQRDQLQKRFDDMAKERNDLHRKLQEGWVYFSGSLYYISSVKKSWQQSRDDCRRRGADLVIINSKVEQKWRTACNCLYCTYGDDCISVNKEYIIRFRKRMWIGLTDRETEGTWKWVDGTRLTTRFECDLTFPIVVL
ncbi:C-type lectin domain family 4 member M [Nibea albiflora]|nr:C-type lectin domain family 4 member M [Nibea albiflora]